MLQSVKSGTNAADLGGLANVLTNTYNQLAAQTSGAVAITPNTEVRGADHTQHRGERS